MTPNEPFSDELIDLLHNARGGAKITLTTITNPSALAGREIYGVLTYGHGEEARIFHTGEELVRLLRLVQRKDS